MSLLRRRLMMQAEARYIHFEDPEAERICLENWDKDGDGRLSKEEAGQVTSISDKFRGNTKLKSFMEFQYFTGLQGDQKSGFQGCTALEKIAIPEGSSICYAMFAGCKALHRVVFPHNMGPSQDMTYYAFSDCNSLEVLDFPATFTGLLALESFERIHTTLVFRAETVVKLGNPDSGAGYSYLGDSIYVPDGLVQNYKSAAGWSGWKAKIKPLSGYGKL